MSNVMIQRTNVKGDSVDMEIRDNEVSFFEKKKKKEKIGFENLSNPGNVFILIEEQLA